MNPMRSYCTAVVMLLMLLAGALPSAANELDAAVTLYPTRVSLSSDEIANPGRGLYRWRSQVYICTPGGNLASNRDAYRRWNWAAIETSEGVYDWAAIRTKLEEATAKGQRLWIGLPVTVGNPTYGPYLPSYMIRTGWGVWFEGDWYPNYNNPEVRARLTALLDSFIANFGADQRIAGVQVLSYGRYGEGYLPWNAPADSPMWATEETARWMVNAWQSRFSGRYPLSIPLFNKYLFRYAMTKEPKWGWTRMALGWPSQMQNVDEAMADTSVIDGVAIGPAVRDRWKYAPVFTEMIGDYGNKDYSQQFSDALAQVPQYHVSLVSNGNFHEPYYTPPYDQWNGCSRDYTSNWTQQNIDDFVLAGKKAGYRYAISSVAVSALSPGSSFTIDTTWVNDGVAPIYEEWDVVFQLRNSAGAVAWERGSTVDLRTILPPSGAVTSYRIRDPFTLPTGVAAGTYKLHVFIPALNQYVRPLQLAITGKQSDGSYLLGQVVVDPPPPVTITLRGSSTASADTSTALTIAKPAGVQAGDVLIAQVAGRNAALSTTAPAGWTLIRRDASSSSIFQSLYWRVAGSAEPSSYSWTVSGATDLGGSIVAYDGVSNSAPVNAHSGQSNSSTTSVAAPSITTTVANARIVFFGGMAWGWTSFTPPLAMTELHEQKHSAVDVTSTAADATQASAGATGTRTAIASDAGTNIAQLIALRPAAQ